MFEIPQTVFDTYNSAVDAMIDVNFGVKCTLFFPAISSPCPNCYFDAMTGKSSNQYNQTGPQPFSNTICPYCNGDGTTSVTVSEDIKLRCYFSPKEWRKLPIEAKIPDGTVQTFGHLEDMPKCKMADYITMNTEKAMYGEYKYKMFGEPVIRGFQKNKYFISFWSRSK